MSIMRSPRDRGFWYFEQIEKDFDLSTHQTKLYSWLRRHCCVYNENGFCGISNEKLAKEIGVSLAQVKKDLKELKDKNLIIIRNPGKRTRKTGQSREIYIALDPYMSEKQLSIEEERIAQLEQEIARLQVLLNQAAADQEISPNAFVFRLYKGLGITDPSMIKRLAKSFNAAYESFALTYGYDKIMNHIEYMIDQIKKENPDNLIAYLMTSLYWYEKRIKKD